MYDDCLLVADSLQGRSAAFGQLVRKYQDRLYNAMVYVVGSRDDAHDVVQEAFFKAFVTLDQLRRAQAFYAWLYRIAFNLALRRRRKRFGEHRRRSVSIEQIRDRNGREPIDSRPGPQQRFEQHERRQQVHRAIDNLSEEHRAVLVLRSIDGHCYQAIADRLGLPIGTVRSRLHRARAEVHHQLQATMAGCDG